MSLFHVLMACLTLTLATGIHYRDVICTAHSNNASVHPANTDFFDSQNIWDLTVERAWVDVGDDCFSPKSNATNIHVNQMYCNGSHGQVRCHRCYEPS